MSSETSDVASDLTPRPAPAGRRTRSCGTGATVEQGSVATSEGVTTFVIAFNGAQLPVRYDGEPGGIFDECVPVVVHGRLTVNTWTNQQGVEVSSLEIEAIHVGHDLTRGTSNVTRTPRPATAASTESGEAGQTAA